MGELEELTQGLLLAVVVVPLAAVVGAVLPRARPTVARVPTNQSVLLSPNQGNALQSVLPVLLPGLVSLPASAPVMAAVETSTNAVSIPVCSITPANPLLVMEENR